MTIELRNFDEIIHPGQPLIAAPHRFIPVNELLNSSEERAYLKQKIAMYVINEAKPKNLEESKARQAGEALRRTLLKRRQDELAKLPELTLRSSATYIPDTSSTAHPDMRHRKG